MSSIVGVPAHRCASEDGEVGVGVGIREEFDSARRYLSIFTRSCNQLTAPPPRLPPPLFLPSNHGSPAAFTFSACRAVLKCHSVDVAPTQTVGVHREVSLFRSVCVWRERCVIRVISCRIIKLRGSETDGRVYLQRWL